MLQNARDQYGKVPARAGDFIDSINGFFSLADGRGMVAHLKGAEASMVGPSNWPEGTNLWDFDSTVDSSYVPGYFYEVSGIGVTNNKGATLSAIYDIITDDYWPTLGPTRNPATIGGWVTVPPSVGGGAVMLRVIDPTGTYTLGVTLNACGTGNSPLECPLSPPSEPWTDLGITQVAWVTKFTPQIVDVAVDKVGRFIPHPNDVNVPPEYINGASILDVETRLGNAARIGPLADGGWYAHYSDGSGHPTGGADTASVLKINSDRTHGGFITPNALSKSLPP